MVRKADIRISAVVLAGLSATGLGGCQFLTTASREPAPKVVAAPTPREKDCLARAMYFEANRSSDDGLLAVGTVVMNRLDSPNYPDSICGIVGQPKQFAEGVLTKPMKEGEKERVEKVATALLAGKRHPEVKGALHFHIAAHTYRYPNMRYVAATGGNRFYEKTDRAGNRPPIFPRAVVKMKEGLVPIQLAFAEMAPEADEAQ